MFDSYRKYIDLKHLNGRLAAHDPVMKYFVFSIISLAAMVTAIAVSIGNPVGETEAAFALPAEPRSLTLPIPTGEYTKQQQLIRQQKHLLADSRSVDKITSETASDAEPSQTIAGTQTIIVPDDEESVAISSDIYRYGLPLVETRILALLSLVFVSSGLMLLTLDRQSLALKKKRSLLKTPFQQPDFIWYMGPVVETERRR